MKKQYLNFEISIDSNEEKDRIQCKNLENTVEVSYHEIDELANDEEEAIDYFIEHLEEQEASRILHLSAEVKLLQIAEKLGYPLAINSDMQAWKCEGTADEEYNKAAGVTIDAFDNAEDIEDFDQNWHLFNVVDSASSFNVDGEVIAFS